MTDDIDDAVFQVLAIGGPMLRAAQVFDGCFRAGERQLAGAGCPEVGEMIVQQMKEGEFHPFGLADEIAQAKPDLRWVHAQL